MNLVEFDRVSKRYALGQRRDFREALVATASRVARRRRGPAPEVWSLRDVSFAVPDGQALGIVGRNGAGKSTILKILAGITVPTSGVSRTRGRVAALLEVGTGFHPELTGRENVYLNGALLGMSRGDISRRFDAIVDFSGIERFLDTPVKRYSSGMYLRLAFAVAAHLEPDVLVVDEILAVGDAEFQRKCIGRMQEAEEEGRALIFVSHDLGALSKICRQSMWLDGGQVRETGPTAAIIRNYLASGLITDRGSGPLAQSGPVAVQSIRVLPESAGSGPALLRGDTLRIAVEFDLTEEVPGFDFSILLTSSSGARVFDELLSDNTTSRFSIGSYRAEVSVPPLLNIGDYSVGVWFGTQHDDFVDLPHARSFTIEGSDAYRSSRILVMNLPFVVHRIDSGFRPTAAHQS